MEKQYQSEKIGVLRNWGYFILSLGTRLSVSHEEHEKFMAKLETQAEGTRNKIRKLHIQLEAFSGTNNSEELDLLENPRGEPKTLVARVQQAHAASTDEPKTIVQSLMPQLADNDRQLMKYSSQAIDRSPVKELSEDIDHFLQDLQAKFDVIKEFLSDLKLNCDSDYATLRANRRPEYKMNKYSEFDIADREIQTFIKSIEPRMELMELYIKTSYFVLKMNESIELNGKPKDYDLIMEDFITLQHKLEFLRELITHQKYDDEKTKTVIADIKGLHERLADLNNKRLERKGKILEIRQKITIELARLKETRDLVMSLNHGIEDELRQKFGQEIDEVITELDSMMEELEAKPELIDRNFVTDWFDKQIKSIQEIEMKCGEIGLGRMIGGRKLLTEGRNQELGISNQSSQQKQLAAERYALPENVKVNLLLKQAVASLNILLEDNSRVIQYYLFHLAKASENMSLFNQSHMLYDMLGTIGEQRGNNMLTILAYDGGSLVFINEKYFLEIKRRLDVLERGGTLDKADESEVKFFRRYVIDNVIEHSSITDLTEALLLEWQADEYDKRDPGKSINVRENLISYCRHITYPQDRRLLLPILARAYLKVGQEFQAKAIWQNIIESYRNKASDKASILTPADYGNILEAFAGIGDCKGLRDTIDAYSHAVKCNKYQEIAEGYHELGETDKCIDYVLQWFELVLKEVPCMNQCADFVSRTFLENHHRLKGICSEMAEIYERAGEFGKAGDFYVMAGNLTKAQACFLKAGEKAGLVTDNIIVAATHYRSGGRSDIAEKMLHDQAMDYENRGLFQKAALFYKSAGELDKARELLVHNIRKIGVSEDVITLCKYLELDGLVKRCSNEYAEVLSKMQAADSYWEAGLYYDQAGSKRKVKNMFQQYLNKVHPENLSSEKLEIISEKLGNQSEMENLLMNRRSELVNENNYIDVARTLALRKLYDEADIFVLLAFEHKQIDPYDLEAMQKHESLFQLIPSYIPRLFWNKWALVAEDEGNYAFARKSYLKLSEKVKAQEMQEKIVEQGLKVIENPMLDPQLLTQVMKALAILKTAY